MHEQENIIINFKTNKYITSIFMSVAPIYEVATLNTVMAIASFNTCVKHKHIKNVIQTMQVHLDLHFLQIRGKIN